MELEQNLLVETTIIINKNCTQCFIDMVGFRVDNVLETNFKK
jgi:hypothetical protein